MVGRVWAIRLARQYRDTAQRRAEQDSEAPQTRKRFAAEGAEPAGGTPAALAAYHKADYEKWGAVIRARESKTNEASVSSNLMQDLLFHNGTVVTMDLDDPSSMRRRLPCAMGASSKWGRAEELRDKYGGARIIDCERKAILPGLVDLHGYLGGSLLKSIGQNLDGGKRRTMLEDLLPAFTDEEWWAADAQLNALERLKMGTTCMFSMMGGNGTRTDDVVFTQAAARELNRIGLRTRIGLGPARPPWPRRFAYWSNGVRSERRVSFEEVIGNCERLLSDYQKNPDGIVDYGVALSRIGNRNEHDPVWSQEREQSVMLCPVLGSVGVAPR